MKIKIKDHEIELIYSQRIYLKYEDLTHSSLTFDQLSSYTALADLFYCTILATLEHKTYRNKLNIKLSKEEFIDWYADDATILTRDFTQWFMGNVNSQMELLQSHIDENDENVKEEDPKK